MIIRKATIEDAKAVKDLHSRSIRFLCKDFYTDEQIEGWVNGKSVEEHRVRLEKHRAFIAEVDNKMTGIIRWNPATNELCSIFVDPAYVRQGIGKRLMARAYEDIMLFDVREIWLDASLNAIPFYETEGWQKGKHMMHGALECVRMTKILSSEKGGLR